MNKQFDIKYFCKCGKRISSRTALYRKGHCRSCANKGRNNPMFIDGRKFNKKYYKCRDCRNKISYENHRIGKHRCSSCAKINNPNKYWLGKSNKDTIIRHHIDLKENSNRILKITQSQHLSMHWKGYEYLVYLGLHKNYIKEFLKKYPKAMIAQNVLHHIDCDRENNNKDNFFYLTSMAFHHKLHQETYEYLVKNSMVDNYIKWFFLMEKKSTTMVKV